MFLGSALFWYKLMFMLELIAGEILFICKFKRRSKFVLRAALCIVALFGISFAIPIVALNAAWASVMFISMFVCVQFAVKACFDESWWNIVFCGIVAYSVEHMAYVLASGVDDIVFIFLDMPHSFDPYSGGNAAPAADGWPSMFISLLVYTVSYFVVYWACYYICGDRIRPHEDLRLGRTSFVVLAGIIVFVDVVFSLIAEYNADTDSVSLWLMRCYNLLTCALALWLQFSQLSNKEVKTELSSVKSIMHERQRQYELSKKSIEVINIKSHDLKHFVYSVMQRNAAADEKELEEIDKALSIYQSSVVTGNTALDVILTEKSLLCEKSDIKLTCIIDGSQLDFMRAADIYSLFGNALDNAIEAVRELEPSKRNIGIYVKREGHMVSVHVENCFARPLTMVDGLPQTTKKDKEYHGFGMVSIRNIVEKYGGIMTVKTVKNTFNLNIIFPRSPQDIPQKRPIVPQEDKLKD